MSDARPVSLTDYDDSWRRFRRLRALWFIVLLMDFGPLEEIFPRVFPAARSDILELVEIAVSFTLLYVIGSKLKHWRCPRCGVPFSSVRRINPLSWFSPPRRCGSCGLPRYASGEAE